MKQAARKASRKREPGKGTKDYSKRIFQHIQQMNGIKLLFGKDIRETQHKGKVRGDIRQERDPSSARSLTLQTRSPNVR